MSKKSLTKLQEELNQQMTLKYDHRDEAAYETADHIKEVGLNMAEAIRNLAVRSAKHDLSKFSREEWPYFAEATRRFKGLEYGSPEYKQVAKSLDPANVHHKSFNSHHPEYYTDGIEGMSLFDLLEMLCDWNAAGKRGPNSSMVKSLELNSERFNIHPTLVKILKNTIDEMGWK